MPWSNFFFYNSKLVPCSPKVSVPPVHQFEKTKGWHGAITHDEGRHKKLRCFFLALFKVLHCTYRAVRDLFLHSNQLFLLLHPTLILKVQQSQLWQLKSVLHLSRTTGTSFARHVKQMENYRHIFCRAYQRCGKLTEPQVHLSHGHIKCMVTSLIRSSSFPKLLTACAKSALSAWSCGVWVWNQVSKVTYSPIRRVATSISSAKLQGK